MSKYTSNVNAKVNAKCPFFQSEYTKSITCEGIIDQTSNIIKFSSESQKNEYVTSNCFQYPNECQLCAAVEKKYGG